VIKELAGILLESLSSEPNIAENKEQLRKLLAQVRQRHLDIFSEVSSDMVNQRGEDGRTGFERLILSLSVVSAVAVLIDYSFMPLPTDEPGFHAINQDGGQSCGPHNSICRLGSKHTHSGGAGSIGG